MQRKSPPPRSERATSTSRLESEMLTLTDTIDSFEQEDIIDSLMSLKAKFMSNETPSGFALSGGPVDEKLVFVKFSPD